MRGDRRSLLTLIAASTLGCSRRLPQSHAPRVVSLSPSTTESLFAIGAGPLVVGRSTYCNYPPEALRLPVVGGFLNPNLEAILALRPTLVVGARGPSGGAVAAGLERASVMTYFPSTDSLSEIDAMIEGIAMRVGAVDAAHALVTSMQRERRDLAAAVVALPRPRALFIVGFTPLIVAGPGSFADELLVLAGGRNAVLPSATASLTKYPTLGLEQLLALDPDVLLDATFDTPQQPRALPIAWSALRAVREQRVIALASETVLRPGPRVGTGARRIAQALHPNALL